MVKDDEAVEAEEEDPSAERDPTAMLEVRRR